MAAVQKSKKSKRPDHRPARARYWASGRLRLHKIRNLVRHNGLSRAKAEALWLRVRIRHRSKLGISSLGEITERKAA